MTLAVAVIVGSLLFVGYTYVAYPLLLKLMSLVRSVPPPPAWEGEWPTLTFVLAAYNEEDVIAGTLERLLALDYPPDRRQILVVSDASTDRTDEIVASFARRGVELLRLPERGGKTAAENAARAHVRSEIVVNVDATVVIEPGALKRLVARFADPTIGVASGRNVSVASVEDHSNVGEAAYVGYEMWVRGLESRVSGISGAAGCFYAVRSSVHRVPVSEALSGDFSSALNARRHGYRAVSVDEAVCRVPRAPSLRQEYRRKVRTFTRGLQTLIEQRQLLNPARYGVFSWILFSHKLCRWIAPWAIVASAGALVVLSREAVWARWMVGALAAAGLVALLGWLWPTRRPMPRLLSVPAFVGLSNIAALHAWMNALRGARNPVWEPTRRRAAG